MRPSKSLSVLRRGAAVAAAVAALAQVTLALPENKAAWSLLLDNQPAAARDAFTKNKDHKDPAVAGEACRGLSMAARFLGDFSDEPRWTFEAFRRDKDTLALMSGMLRILRFRDSWDGHDLSLGYDIGQAFAKKPSPLTAQLVIELSQRYINDGDAGKAADLLEKMGLVRDWWMIGPFSNISGSGFDQAYPPEAAIELGKTYTGKNGNQVTWSPLHSHPPSAWILSPNHVSADNAILYYASQVESPRERKALLCFGASGSFKVFVNGRLELSERVFRNTGPDVFVREVTLRKGANRVLVKLGDEEKRSNFLLRFAEADGRGIADLKAESPEGSFPAVSGEPQGSDTPVIDREEAYLKEKLKRDAGDEDAALLLMDLYDSYENTDSAEVFGLARLERAKGSALWQSMLAETMRRSGQVTRSQEYLKAAYRSSPLCYTAWKHELTRLANSAGPETVLDFINKGPEAHRNATYALMMEMAALAKQGQGAEALKIFARIEKEADFDEETAAMLATVYQAQGRKSEAYKVWNKLLKYRRGSAQTYLLLAGQQMKAGDVGDAIDLLKSGMKLLPDNPTLPMSIANARVHQKDYADAEKYVTAALELSPTSPALLGLKATIETLSGKTDDARQALEKSVRWNYNDFPSWDKLRKLDGGASYEEMTPLPSVDSIIKASAGWEGLKRERGAVLSLVNDVFFYPSRAVKRRTFLVASLPTQEAVNTWKEYTIYSNPSFQTLAVTRALARKANGSEVDAEVRGRSIVFKTLEPGDCIVLEWTLKDDFDGEMARQAWGAEDFRLGVPTFDSRLRLVMPAGGDTIGFTVRGKDIKTAQETRGGVTVRSFSRGAYLVPVDQKFLPVDDETSPDVLYSTFSDWSRISDWYANLTENKVAPSPILRRLADSLFNDAAGGKLSAEEKIARVHYYVSNNIAYSSLPFRQSGWVPQTAQEALASRLGDCKDKAALAKSLLALAGIESHLVLVATRSEFGTRPGPVGPNFNHCILAVTVGGKERFMDLTDPDLPWTRLPWGDQGAIALVVRRGNRALTHLPEDAPAERRVDRKMTLSLADSGGAVLESRTVRTGVFAGGQRGSYRFLSQEERERNMRESLSSDYPEVSLDSVWFGDLEPRSDSVAYGYKYRSAHAVKVSGRTRIFSLNIPDHLLPDHVPDGAAHPEGVDLHSSPYCIGSFALTGNLTFPAKWKLLSLPSPVKLKTKYGEYELTFKLKGNTLAYARKGVFNFADTVPGPEVEKARAFLNKIVQADDVQLVFNGP